MTPMFRSLEQFLLDNSLDHALQPWGEALPALVTAGLNPQRHGDLPAWQKVLDDLPSVKTDSFDFTHEVRIGQSSDTNQGTKDQINRLLRDLIPWRKGPLTVHDTVIDTEWRSDWKWERVLPHLDSLDNRLILDVGCGNGYHCWRMLGAGAKRVIGVDPSPRFVMQFYATKHFAPDFPIDVIPATLDDMPALPPAFDTVFSMGVLYHRPSPIEHLKQLKSLLTPDGQLVLETLVIDGDAGRVLVPEGRYAMMNNVWFIPTPATLVSWLRKLGFQSPRVVDINQTSLQEQRQTEWMTFHSLEQFLDPDDHHKTVEGHPAPIRAVIVADNNGR